MRNLEKKKNKKTEQAHKNKELVVARMKRMVR